MKFGIEHIAIFAKDTKALSDWYKDLFDGEVVYDNGKGTYFIAFSDKSMIEFCCAPEENVPTETNVAGIRHIAISVDDFDAAVEKINEAIAIAKEYENADVAGDAETLIPQVYMQKGNTAYKAKDMAAAVAAYTKVVELNPENGDAYLLIGRAQAACGKMDEAVAAYEAAMKNGEEAAAKKQLSTLFLKKAQASLKAGKSQETIDMAMKSNEYLENANAYNLAAKAAQKLGNNALCIENFVKYLELKPNAKDAAGVTFTIAALYQQDGNKAKAIEFYEKVANDPQYGAGAQEQLKTLK